MNADFHYYATYCAAILAGYSHQASLKIAYSANFVDCCSKTFLTSIKAPREAATTQLQLEMMDAPTDLIGLQDITRIWSSFHFLPGDLYATKEKKCSKNYLDKYRLICDVNSDLLVETVNLAKGSTLQATGIAMHVLADTWAHRYYAGTPSLVINNTNYDFYELLEDETTCTSRLIDFKHNPGAPDDLDKSIYVNTVYQLSENSIMNLGHGRAGHLPDYSFARYRYLPAWGDYELIIKDNPHDFYCAFTQMIHAMKYLRGEVIDFEKDCYDTEAVSGLEDEIRALLIKRRPDSSEDWKALGERLSGEQIPDFDMSAHRDEYLATAAELKDDTFLGRFIIAALAQKSMVTNKIFESGNKLAGYSIDYNEQGFKGIKAYAKLVTRARERLGA